jgi:thiamine pyrophosphate-dependent acetolactate synthase large subunit-like protein
LPGEEILPMVEAVGAGGVDMAVCRHEQHGSMHVSRLLRSSFRVMRQLARGISGE